MHPRKLLGALLGLTDGGGYRIIIE